jgi:hypothetical protein
VVAGLLIFSVVGKINLFANIPFITGISIQVDSCLQVMLVSFELALAITLIVEDQNPAIIRVTVALFVLYSAYLCFNRWVLRHTGCGCGAGEQILGSPRAKFVFSVLRNLAVLVLLCLYHSKLLRHKGNRSGVTH